MADVSLAISINGYQILGGDTKISQPWASSHYSYVSILVYIDLWQESGINSTKQKLQITIFVLFLQHFI
jgi:hypothetical protein